jgi:hypothetical protein
MVIIGHANAIASLVYICWRCNCLRGRRDKYEMHLTFGKCT